MSRAAVASRFVFWAASEETSVTDMISSQFGQSRFSIIMATGLPRVLPCRTPERNRTWSFSIFIRPAAAISPLPALQFVVDKVEIYRKIGGKPFDQSNQGLAVRLSGRAISQHRSEYTGKPEVPVTA